MQVMRCFSTTWRCLFQNLHYPFLLFLSLRILFSKIHYKPKLDLSREKTKAERESRSYCYTPYNFADSASHTAHSKSPHNLMPWSPLAFCYPLPALPQTLSHLSTHNSVHRSFAALPSNACAVASVAGSKSVSVAGNSAAVVVAPQMTVHASNDVFCRALLPWMHSSSLGSVYEDLPEAATRHEGLRRFLVPAMCLFCGVGAAGSGTDMGWWKY